ncbi:MAG: hypothetical protein WBB22_06735 [Anaerolineae bacterium]
MKRRHLNCIQFGKEYLPPTQLLIVLGLGLLIRLGLAWLSTPTLVQMTIPDDSFYYFAIARHMALDGSVSINGLNLTNGFHPLWLLVISPFYLLFPYSPGIPLHLALTIGAILDVVTGLFAYKLVRLLTGNPAAALISVAVYVFNPRAILNAVSGMETSLNVLYFALFVYVYTVIRRRGPTVRRYVLFGLVGGLLLLARTDNVFLLSVIYLHAVWTAIRRRSGGGLFISYVVTACLLAPWLLWNYFSFGTLLQSSGIAVPHVLRELFVLGSGASTTSIIATSLRQLLRVDIWLQDASCTGLPPLVGLPLWTMVGLASIKTVYHRRRRESLESLELVGLPLLACVLLLVFHLAIRWFPRSWYFAPLSFVFAVLLGVLVDAGRRDPPGLLWKHRAMVGLLVSEVFVLIGVLWWPKGLYPWQVEMYQASLWLRRNTPAEARIGSFNSGLQAYFCDRTVINLDGTVNGEALEAIKQKDLLNYMQEMEIQYIADYSDSIHGMYAPFYGDEPRLQLLYVIDEEGIGWKQSLIHIYRLLD